MTETVQTLDEQIEALKQQKRDAKMVEVQRKMLPALERKRDRLLKQAEAIDIQREKVLLAIGDIEEGRPTQYRLRKAPVRRKKGEVEG